MGWFRRRRGDTTPGYEDNAALGGFGGYQPSDPPRFPSGAGFETPVEEPPRAAPKRISPAPKRPKWRRSSRAPWVGLALIALIAGVLNAFGLGKSHRPSPPASRPPLVSTPSPRVAVPALVEGWKSVAGKDGTYAYDVPPNWSPEPGTLHGWEKTAAVPGISLITSAFLDSGFCPGQGASKRGGAGVTTENVADPDAAARQAVSDLGVSHYSPDNGPLARVTPEPGVDATVDTLKETKLPARVVVALVVPSEVGGCSPQRALVAAMAFGSNDPGKSGVVMAYADQDVPGAATREQLLRILHSYRFVPAADRSMTTPPPTTYR